MKDLLEYITKSIVEHPDDVFISQTEEGEVSVLKIKANPEDLKIVIGKEGKTIRAIREILKIPATKLAKKIRVEIEE